MLAQFGEGVAAHVHGRTGGVLDVSVVHADELAVAGGAYENFDGEGAAAYGLCVSEGSVLGADVAVTAVGDEKFIGLVEQLMCAGAAVYCRELCAGARAEAPMKPQRLSRFLEIFGNAVTVVVLFRL